MICDDLRLGGTLSGTGITGGTSINSAALEVVSWSDVYGYPGIVGDVSQVSGRPGGYLAGDLLGKPRFLNLSIRATRVDAAGGLTAPTAPEQLVENTDLFLSLLVPNTLLELDMPDTTSRFLTVTPLDAFSINQPKTERTWTVPLVGDWPYWREGGNETTDTVSGADTVTILGNDRRIRRGPRLLRDGTFTNSTAGWSITITGSAGRSPSIWGTYGSRRGVPAEPDAEHRRDWGWFNLGSNTVTSSVSVGLTYRTNWV